MSESDLRKWIENKKISSDNQAAIEELIKAFSEYICAVDQEYLYNKTFLNCFIESFISSTLMLQSKRECMLQIIDKLNDYKESINIDIDGALKYEGKNKEEVKNHISLSNSFDRWMVNSNKIRYQIRFVDNPGFVISGTMNIDESEQKKEIEGVVSLFKNRLKMYNENKKLSKAFV